jgi:short-subunit dehydrogenase
MTSGPILLLFSCGSNIGASVAEAPKAKGYNLALVTRSIDEGTQMSKKELHIKADVSDTSAIPKIFGKAKEKFGIPPSVVVTSESKEHD